MIKVGSSSAIFSPKAQPNFQPRRGNLDPARICALRRPRDRGGQRGPHSRKRGRKSTINAKNKKESFYHPQAPSDEPVRGSALGGGPQAGLWPCQGLPPAPLRFCGSPGDPRRAWPLVLPSGRAAAPRCVVFSRSAASPEAALSPDRQPDVSDLFLAPGPGPPLKSRAIFDRRRWRGKIKDKGLGPPTLASSALGGGQIPR